MIILRLARLKALAPILKLDPESDPRRRRRRRRRRRG